MKTLTHICNRCGKQFGREVHNDALSISVTHCPNDDSLEHTVSIIFPQSEAGLSAEELGRLSDFKATIIAARPKPRTDKDRMREALSVLVENRHMGYDLMRKAIEQAIRTLES